MRAAWFLVVAATLAACKKEPVAGQSSSTPVSTAALDALWQLAPAGTELGLVASPRALSLIDGAKTRLRHALDQQPDLATIRDQLDAELREAFGTTSMSVEDKGLSLAKGFALFATRDGRVLVLPVGDRDKFLATVHGTKGKDTDTFADLTCKTVHGVYACATVPSLLDGLGKRGYPDGTRLVGARGDVELAGAIPGPSGSIPFAIVLQLERGAFVSRIAVKGVGGLFPIKLLAGGKPRASADHTAGFAVLDPATLFASMPAVPDGEIVPGVSGKALIDTIAGPMTVSIDAGVPTWDMRVPLSDGALAQKVVAQCDQLPPLQALGVTVQNGVCHVPVPQMLLELDAWVEGKDLRVGKKGAAPAPASVPMSAIGKELAGRAWPIVMWGRGTILATPQMPPMPGDVPDMTKMAVRAMAMFDELGFGIRMEGDVLHAVFSARTAYANPDDVIAKIEAIPPDDVVSGHAVTAAKALADSAPGSPFAADYKAGYTGLMIPTAAIGMLAAVAIPAFMDYMKKSKSSEASIQLNKLGKNLKTYYATTGALPVGTAPLTPATPCCSGPHNKCNAPYAWTRDPVWKELEFSIDEPHMYRYEYTSTDGKTFEAHAVSDLDCDGKPATWILRGGPDDTGMLKLEILQPARGVY